MRVIETALAGVLLVEPTIYRDSRGFFLETFHAPRYAAAGMTQPFVQDNHSRSVKNTLRGLHWQIDEPQDKLIRVIEGEIFDVAVDVRPESPTFGKWAGAILSAENFLQCYIPAGFAHGFCVLSDIAQVEYKCTAVYNAAGERGLAWNDPDVAIAWPIDTPLLSARDQQHPTLRELRLALR